MKKRTRSIGQRIRQACEIIAKQGPSNYRQVHAKMQGAELQNVSQYLCRAVALELMTVKAGKPFVYSVVDNWREIIDPPTKAKVVPTPRIERKSWWGGVSSVWGMAGQPA